MATGVLAGTLLLSNISPDKEVFYKTLFDKPSEPVTKLDKNTSDTLTIGKNELTLTSITITNEDSKTAKESTTKYYLIDFEALKTIKDTKEPTREK